MSLITRCEAMVCGATVPVKAAFKILDAAIEHGIKPDELCHPTGIDPAVLSDPDHRILKRQLISLYEHAARFTGDDCFGLHLAERTSPTAFDVLGYAVEQSDVGRRFWQDHPLLPYLDGRGKVRLGN